METIFFSPPAATDPESWASWAITYYDCCYDSKEMVRLHALIHEVWGAQPHEAIYTIEQNLSQHLRRMGIEHRYKDALSTQAGTFVEAPSPPKMEEVQIYCDTLQLHSGAIRLVKDLNDNQFFIHIDDAVLPESTHATILKRIQKQMPPGIRIKPLNLNRQNLESFAVVSSLYNLQLQCSPGMPTVEPWASFAKTTQTMQSIFKSGAPSLTMDTSKLSLHTQVHKTAEGEVPEHYVVGPVLYPDVEDTHGHIYSREEVVKACHWFAEHSEKTFAINHILQGGTPCQPGDVVLLQNYTMPMTVQLNGETIPEDTWMLGAGIRNPQIWEEFQSGKIQAWSIGADVLATPIA